MLAWVTVGGERVGRGGGIRDGARSHEGEPASLPRPWARHLKQPGPAQADREVLELSRGGPKRTAIGKRCPAAKRRVIGRGVETADRVLDAPACRASVQAIPYARDHTRKTVEGGRGLSAPN